MTPRDRLPTIRSSLVAPASLPLAALFLACGPVSQTDSKGPVAPDPVAQPEAAPPRVEPVDETPPTLRLPDNARPIRYALDLTVLPDQPTFQGEVTIELAIARPSRILWLDARALTVEHAELVVAGKAHPARVVPGGAEFVGFAFDPPIDPIDPGYATLRIRYSGKLDDERTEGLYRVKESDTGWHAYTMFEPLDARRAFPCFDEPAYKVPWQLTLRVKKDHVAAANTPIASESTDDKTGLKVVRFQETRPLPSYLVAFMVGPFDVVDAGTVGKDNVRLRFILPKNRQDELWYAREATPRVVALLEAFFGIPYPFEKLDVAVVPRFWGTMEHPGLVAMGQPLTLIRRDEDTVRRRQDYANILIHELGHYWFGDLVTAAWWDDIWLNEGLDTWADRVVTAQFEPSWQYDILTAHMRDSSMDTDALLSAKRIRQVAASNDDIAHSFDGAITYGKTGHVIAMFEHWIGEDAFRGAITHYLQKFAWGNANADDFIDAMTEKIRSEFGPAFRTFLDQPGYPLVSVNLTCARGERPRIELTQRRYVNVAAGEAPAQLWTFPVCMRYGAGQVVHRQCTLMTSEKRTVELDQARTCPSWLVANEEGVGYYRVQYSPELLTSILARGSRNLTLRERVILVSDLIALMKTGGVTADRLLALAPSLARERNRYLVVQALEILGDTRRVMPEALAPSYARYIRNVFGAKARALGWKKRPGEATDATELRPTLIAMVAIHGEDKALIAQAKKLALAYLKDRSAIDPEMIGVVLGVAARSADPSLFDAYLAAMRSATDHREKAVLAGPLGGFTDPALVERALALVVSGELDLRDATGIVGTALGNRKSRTLAWEFIEKNFDTLAQHLSSLDASLVFHLPRMFCDREMVDRVKAFFDTRVDRFEGALPNYKNALEIAEACIAVGNLQEPSISRYFKR